jgi:peptide/nickel transport system permease protein
MFAPRAKGLLERTVIAKHAMRNALTPVITLGAIEFSTLLSGAVLTSRFSPFRAGKLIVDAVFNRDYAVVQVVLVTRLYRAQSHRRRRLHPGQSAAAG